MSILFGLLLVRRFYCRSALSLSPGRTGGLLPRINAPSVRRVLSPCDGRRARKAACRLYPLQRAKREVILRYCFSFLFFYEFFMDSNPERVSEFKSRVLHVHFTVAKHGFVLFIFINQLIKQRSAAVKDIFICHFEIS